MSEHRAAAHIGGRYTVLAAFVTGTLGLVGGWLLRDVSTAQTDTPQTDISEIAPVGAESVTDDAVGGDAPIDSGALIRTYEPKRADAAPSEITMDAYYRLLADEGVPQLDVAKQYIGKRVKWTGYFYSLGTYLDSKAQRYRVLLTHQPDDFHDYLYFYLSVDDEPTIARMRNGSAVAVTGVLTGRTTLSDVHVDSVTAPDPETDR